MKKSLSGLLDRILFAKTEYEKDVLNDKYEEYSIALEKKIKEFNNLKNNVRFVSISSERLKILKEYINSKDLILTKEIVEAFIVAGIEIDSENVIFIVSNSTNITNSQISSSREDIMKMLGIIEKKTVCKKGIKTYTVNYRVVVL